MARGTGRPMAVLVLSDEERSYLERQARRRRVARSISDRCRMILRCADGLTNKAVAAELGVHEHTVGKWRRRFLKERIEGLSDEPRPGRQRTLTDDQVAKVVERTLSGDAGGRHPLVVALDGRGKRPFAHDDLAHLGRLRLAAAPLGDVQALQRSALRGQGPRHRRPVSLAAGPRAGALRRREEPDPGARPYTAGPADVAGHPRTAHARLQAPTERPHCSQPSMSLPASSSASATGATGPGSFSTS